MIILDQIIYYTCRDSVCVLGSLCSRASHSEVRGNTVLALRGLARGQLVVKLITVRFTPLLYIRQEI
jgi:hypothetical protein